MTMRKMWYILINREKIKEETLKISHGQNWNVFDICCVAESANFDFLIFIENFHRCFIILKAR
jgi:hypothetical protein